MAEQRRWRATPESSNSGAAQPAAPLPEDPLPHPMINRERIAIGPLRKYKVTEWIWIGWCLCEDSQTPVQEKTSDEPYSRCTVCRKFLPHPMINRERIAIGPLRKYKVTEWIWIGWCLCEDSQTPVQEKTSDEPYSRCTVCRKFAKDLTRCSSISNKCQDATHPFSNLEEAFASLSSAAPPANSVDNNAERPA